MQQNFYILIGDATIGPLSLHELAEKVRKGELQINVLYAVPNGAEWRPLSTCPELQNYLEDLSVAQPSTISDKREFQKRIIAITLEVLFPIHLLEGNTIAFDQCCDTVWQIVEGRRDRATARLKMTELLRTMTYIPAPDEAGTLSDLTSEERRKFALELSVGLAQGYRRWLKSCEQSVLDMWPAQELSAVIGEGEWCDWKERWRSSGGTLLGGRMIALKNDPIWTNISAFGLPFPPFDICSWMDVTDVDVDQAEEIGLKGSPPPLSRIEWNFGPRLRERWQLFTSQQFRLNAMEYRIQTADAYSLLEIAQEEIDRIGELTGDTAAFPKAIIDKALEKGFGENTNWQARAHEMLAEIYRAIGEDGEADTLELKAIEDRIAFTKTRGTGWDLLRLASELKQHADEITPQIFVKIGGLAESAIERFETGARGIADAYRILAEISDECDRTEDAERYRAKLWEVADSGTLLIEAERIFRAAPQPIVPSLANKTLELVERAIAKCLHNERAAAYRLQGEIFETIENNSAAIEAYRSALALNPKVGVKNRLRFLEKLALSMK